MSRLFTKGLSPAQRAMLPRLMPCYALSDLVEVALRSGTTLHAAHNLHVLLRAAEIVAEAAGRCVFVCDPFIARVRVSPLPGPHPPLP